MIVKTKRHHSHGVSKLATGGEIKELLVKEDLVDPKKAIIQICYKGKVSSGIIEMSADEIERLYQTVSKTRPKKVTRIKRTNTVY